MKSLGRTTFYKVKSMNYFVDNNLNSFTHFVSLPIIDNDDKKILQSLQNQIISYVPEDQRQFLVPNNPNLFHLTVSMLALANESRKLKAQETFLQQENNFRQIVPKLQVNFNELGVFKTHDQNVTIIYLKIDEKCLPILNKISDLLIRAFLEAEILDSINLKKMNLIFDEKTKQFRPETYHMTLFRVKKAKNQPLDLSVVFDKVNIDLQFNIHNLDISTRFEYEDSQFYKPLCRIQI